MIVESARAAKSILEQALANLTRTPEGFTAANPVRGLLMEQDRPANFSAFFENREAWVLASDSELEQVFEEAKITLKAGIFCPWSDDPMEIAADVSIEGNTIKAQTLVFRYPDGTEIKPD